MASKRKLTWIGLAIGVLGLGATGVDATFRNLGVVGMFNAVTGAFSGELTAQPPTISGDVLIWGSPAQITALLATTIANTSTVVGSPTGGNEGAGTINAQNIFVNGVPVSAAGLPINSLPAQTAEYNAHGNGFKNLLYIIANGIIQYASNATNALLGFSINGAYNPVAYGADPTGVADSTTAIEAASAAAVNSWSSGSGVAASVRFPGGFYKHTQPLIFTAASTNPIVLDAGGDSYASTQLVASGYTGTNVLIAPNNLISSMNGGVITSTALATGSGQSLLWTAGSPMFLDLSDILGSLPTGPNWDPYLNGKTAFTFRAFVKPSSAGAFLPIASSSGSVDYSSSSCSFNANFGGGIATICTGAWALWIDTDNKLHGLVKTSGEGTQYVVSTGTASTSATNEADIEFDGAHIGVALNGTWGSLVAATGTIVQRNDETTVIGSMIGFWPHIVFNNASYFLGSIYSPEIAKVARHTLGSNYTQATAAYTFNSNTIYGSYFDQTIDMPSPSPSSGHVFFGANNFNGSSSTTTWSRIWNNGLGCCGGDYNLHDVSLTNGTVGAAINSGYGHLSNIRIINQTYMGINTSPNASFQTFIDGIYGSTTGSSMGNMVIEGGITTIRHDYIGGSGLLTDYFRNSSYSDAIVAGQSNTKWGIVFSQAGLMRNVEDDNENGGFCSGITLEIDPVQASGAFTLEGNHISPCSTSGNPPITYEGGDGGLMAFTGNEFQWTGAPASVIHNLSSGVGIATFTGNRFPSPGIGVPSIPLSDSSLLTANITGPPNLIAPNDTGTGTTINTLTKLTTAGKAVIAATTDTHGIVGIVPRDSGAGAAGYALVQTAGTVQCVFDAAAAPTAGDWFLNSSTVAGACLDSGTASASAPPTGCLGKTLATGSVSTTQPVQLQPCI